jgi:hypothetical protein
MALQGALKKGDRISSSITSVGRSARTGTVKRVIGGREHTRYEVEWDSGGVSIVYPAYVQVEPRAKPKPAVRKATARRPKEPSQPHAMTAVAGDRLVVRPHHQGEPQRDAEIVEVLGPGGTPPFRLVWSDTGEETLLFPGADAYVEHLASPRRTRR